MFESVRQTSGLDSAKHFFALLVSLLIHTAALCTLALLPLLLLNALPQGDLLTFLIAPPPPPAPPPAPAPPRPAGASARHTIALANYDATPITIPRGIPDPPSDEDVDIGSMLPNITQGGSGVGPGGFGNPSAAIFALNPIVPPPPPPPPHSRDKMSPPHKIGGDVLAGKLLFKVDPKYPRLAQLTHVSGSVILEATVDEEGNVVGIKVLSGHVLLNDAAVEAVKQWKYSPTVLNGEPIKVQAAITINFNLR
jgi:periplasmic protein TonB